MRILIQFAKINVAKINVARINVALINAFRVAPEKKKKTQDRLTSGEALNVSGPTCSYCRGITLPIVVGWNSKMCCKCKGKHHTSICERKETNKKTITMDKIQNRPMKRKIRRGLQVKKIRPHQAVAIYR